MGSGLFGTTLNRVERIERVGFGDVVDSSYGGLRFRWGIGLRLPLN